MRQVNADDGTGIAYIPQVSEEMDDCAKKIDELMSTVNELEQSLTPVLRVGVKVGEEVIEEDELCPLASGIRTNNNHLRSISSQIQGILKRLEL